MRKDRNGRVSQAQMKKLLDLLSEDGVLSGGKVLYENTNKRMFWKRMALQLNSVDKGADKNLFKWCKMWIDWKTKTKKKADILLSGGFENQKPNITKLELRLLKLINYPVENVLSVLSEGKASTQKEIDILTNESDPILNSNMDDNSIEMDNENKREFIYLGAQNTIGERMRTNSNDAFDYERNADSDQRIKIKVEDSANKDMLEDYKTKARFALERERTHQKSEELKLKALELKLKADELKLKESEISKVNYLTQIEEGKLKCMVDISASLKELVQWTKNGSTRFHNVM